MLKLLRLWFVLVLLLYIILVVVNYTQYEKFEWQGFYNILSLFFRGFLLSALFYFLVVHLPTANRRRIIKNNLRELYKEIKHELIREILWCSKRAGWGSFDVTEDLVEKLFDVDEFSSFFNGAKKADEGWYAVCNHIQNNPDNFSYLIQRLKILARQLDFVLHNCDIQKQEHYDFFKRLEIVIMEFEDMDINAPNDEVKIFARFMWGLFAGWSFVDGSRDYDIVERMIDDI